MPTWAKVSAFAGLGLAIIIYLAMFLISSKIYESAVRPLQL
jgi:hypothetical protein